MGQEIREIEITRISPNLRIVYATECIEKILQEIKSCGQQEPIHISFEHDSFRILDGEKRWRAFKKLGMTRIRAILT